MFKRIFKNRKAMISVGVVGCALPVAMILGGAGPKLDINVFDGTIVWKYNRSLGESTYNVYKDGEKILTSTQTKFKDVSVDKEPPHMVDDVNTVYEKDKIILKWNDVSDNGSVGVYEISVEDHVGNVVTKSAPITMETASGFGHYLVEIDNKANQVNTTEYVLDLRTLKEGIHTVKVYSVDKAGNTSSAFETKIEIIKPFIDKKNFIKVNSSDDYRLDAFLNGESIIKSDGSVNIDRLKDIDGPNKIEGVLKWDRGGAASIGWKPAKDKSSKYEIELTGESVDGKKAISFVELGGKATGIKGYYYKVTKNKSDMVTADDKFTETSVLMNVDIDKSAENLYIHIAAVDGNGNIGEVHSEKIR